jgi:hemoglobin
MNDTRRPLPAAVGATRPGAVPVRPPDNPPANPHSDAIGGTAAVVRLVDAFYARMDALPQARAIRAMHADDLGATRALLVTYLCEWLGGPRDYTAARGRPQLRRAHARFAIGPAERDAWMNCMRGALAEVVADAPLRAALEAAFLRVAQAVRNDASAPPHR